MKVSIITPSFNRANIINETAASIFRQTYANWEWVIVDDGSTDDSWEIISDYAKKDNRVRIYNRDRGPKGACTCRNIAVEKSTGDYLIFLDTDDLLSSVCLENRVRTMMQNPQCDFIVFPVMYFENVITDLKTVVNVRTEESDLYRCLRGDLLCQGTGPMWKRKSFIGQLGGWNESLKVQQDQDLFLKSLYKKCVYKVPADAPADVFFRISPKSISRSALLSPEKLNSSKQVLLNACEWFNDGTDLEITRNLRIRAAGIAIAFIRAKDFEQAREIISWAKGRQLFSPTDVIDLRLFLNSFKLRLYRLPFWKGYSEKLFKRFRGAELMGKVKYTGEIIK